ncbi:MAG: HEAT repeat domain-containing protein [Pirellulaceae bacterium]
MNSGRRRRESSAPVGRGDRGWLRRVLAIGAIVLAAGYVAGDWYWGLPDGVVPAYVGRAQCVDCHAQQTQAFEGSHHDLAMDVASDQTVLGDFNDARLEHYGISSRMFRDGKRFMVHTEGPDGKLADFEIKYVFGVEPLQQYMVEFDRTAEQNVSELARLQVLRISWDTARKKWFYLSPPDVKEKLAPSDPLHWTGYAQNWNHMCASCHSTDLKKGFDLSTQTYHTTFAEIDVSCEACHGPGSLHVQLARAPSLFWDRKRGYALATLKGETNVAQIQACAPCHSRRSMLTTGYCAGQNYHDYFANTLLTPDTYYPDGQVLDEVYVYGSFLQSKMYHKGIKCTDCHNPHSTRVKSDTNTLCTSCHQHQAAKYDTPAHHHHQVGSQGARCVECHMPASPFMDVDMRRDHSFKVPRPELSLQLGTPNACAGCHVDLMNIAEAKREQLTYYADWLRLGREGDTEVVAELQRVNAWSADYVTQWYGERKPAADAGIDYAHAFAAAWDNQREAGDGLLEVASDRRLPAMIRASAISELARIGEPKAFEVATELLTDREPLVRATAVDSLAALDRPERAMRLPPLLLDDTRMVRIAAARALADVPEVGLRRQQVEARELALQDYEQGLRNDADQVGAHMALAGIYEDQGQVASAVQEYRDAIRVQPRTIGPRSNLAQLLHDAGKMEEAQRLRAEELELMEHDVGMLPDSAVLQYRFGLALYLAGAMDRSASALETACRLEPNLPTYRMTLTLLYEKQQRWEEALASARRLLEIDPDDPTNRALLERIQRRDGDPEPAQ